METLRWFVRLGRPLFLVGGLVMYAVGVAAGRRSGMPLLWMPLVLGQGIVTCLQWMTHYANDYFDLEADRANETPTRWSGGSRVLVHGRLPRRVALIAAQVLAAAAAVLTGTLTISGHAPWYVLSLIALMASLAWAYSAPPFCLHSRGVGELVSAMVVGGLVPSLGYALQGGSLDRLALVICLPLMCLQFAMVLAVEFPDVEGDARVGKRTLVVRWGRRRAAWLACGTVVLAYLALPGLPIPAALGAASTLPLGAYHGWRLGAGDAERPAAWAAVAQRGVMLFIGFGLGMLAGLLAGR